MEGRFANSSLNSRQRSCQRRLGSESFGWSDGSDVTRSSRHRRSVLRSGPTQDCVAAAPRRWRRRLGRSCSLQRSTPRSTLGSSHRVPGTSTDPLAGRGRNRRRRCRSQCSGRPLRIEGRRRSAVLFVFSFWRRPSNQASFLIFVGQTTSQPNGLLHLLFLWGW